MCVFWVLLLILTTVGAYEVIDWRTISHNDFEHPDRNFSENLLSNDTKGLKPYGAPMDVWGYGLLLLLRVFQRKISKQDIGRIQIPDLMFAPTNLKCTKGTLDPISLTPSFKLAYVLTRNKSATILTYQDIGGIHFEYSHCELNHELVDNIKDTLNANRVYWEIVVNRTDGQCTMGIRRFKLFLKIARKQEFHSYYTHTLIPQLERTIENKLNPLNEYLNSSTNKILDLACTMLFESS